MSNTTAMFSANDSLTLTSQALRFVGCFDPGRYAYKKPNREITFLEPSAHDHESRSRIMKASLDSAACREEQGTRSAPAKKQITFANSIAYSCQFRRW
jgi:hypothetical protein